MRNIFSLLALLFFYNAATAQRELEYIADINSASSTITFNHRLLLAGNRDTYLRVYNDEEIRGYTYPLIGGVRLRFFTQYQRLIVYNSAVYLVLGDGTSGFLHRFNGTTFSSIPVPGNVVSSPAVFGTHLYVLSNVGTSVQLYRYDGITVSAVTDATLPVSTSCDLIVEGAYLYLIRGGTVKRYDGATVTALPHIDVFDRLERIYASGSNAYFLSGHGKIWYYNGTTVVSVFEQSGSTTNAEIWRGDLYFLSTRGSELPPSPLYRAVGPSVSAIALPPGADLFMHSNLAVYNDNIYIQVTYSATDNRVIRYDGDSFSDVFAIPGPLHSYGTSFLRDDDLIIQPEIVNGNKAYEYDGTVFTELTAPVDHTFASYKGSTNCNHLWLTSYLDEDDELDPYRWALSKESKGCPPVDTSVIVIPGHFLGHDRFGGGWLTRGRNWCWSEIPIDWEIVPVCPIPEDCPLPVYQVKMFNKQGVLKWEKKFSSPTTLKVPLKDDQPYKTVFSSVEDGVETLMVFEDNLVPAGIDAVNISMKPFEDYFKLSVTTKKNKQVPLKMELLDGKGQVLWQKQFTAPFAETIKDRVQEPGQTLRFSVPQAQKSGNNNLDFITYPNPSKGEFFLQVKTDGSVSEVRVTITSLQGEKLFDQNLQTPFSRQVRLENVRPGFYVVKIKTEQEMLSRMIRVE